MHHAYYISSLTDRIKHVGLILYACILCIVIGLYVGKLLNSNHLDDIVYIVILIGGLIIFAVIVLIYYICIYYEKNKDKENLMNLFSEYQILKSLYPLYKYRFVIEKIDTQNDVIVSRTRVDEISVE